MWASHTPSKLVRCGAAQLLCIPPGARAVAMSQLVVDSRVIRMTLGHSQQIKDLKVALQCLSKIGAEMLIEGYEDRVSGSAVSGNGLLHVVVWCTSAGRADVLQSCCRPGVLH